MNQADEQGPAPPGAGAWEIRGRARDATLGALAGCGLGVLAAVLYAAHAVALENPEFFRDSIEVAYRWRGLAVGVPAGSILGGIAGFLAGTFLRRKGIKASAEGGGCRHEPRRLPPGRPRRPRG